MSIKTSNNKCNIKNSEITIGGLLPLTTIDYPEHLAAVVFCQGCPFSCHYCHNPALKSSKSKVAAKYSWEQAKSFLRSRRGLLEAVVFSGGEPLLQKKLCQAIKEVKELGFRVGLHTSGVYPQKFKQVLPLLDWVGMDVKAPIADYQTITKVHKSGQRALESIKLLLASKIACEFRTTIHPKLLSNEQIMQISDELKSLGVENYTLQLFRKEGCENIALHDCRLQDYPRAAMLEKIKTKFTNFKIT